MSIRLIKIDDCTDHLWKKFYNNELTDQQKSILWNFKFNEEVLKCSTHVIFNELKESQKFKNSVIKYIADEKIKIAVFDCEYSIGIDDDFTEYEIDKFCQIVYPKISKKLKKIIKAVEFCDEILKDERIKIIPDSTLNLLNKNSKYDVSIIDLIFRIYAYLSCYRTEFLDGKYENLCPKMAMKSAFDVAGIFLGDELIDIFLSDYYINIIKPCLYYYIFTNGNDENIMRQGIELFHI